MMDKVSKRMEELEARQLNTNSQHDQTHTMDAGRPKDSDEPQGDEDDLNEDEDDSGSRNINMNDQFTDNNQPEQVLTPECDKINTGGHTMNAGSSKKGKQSRRPKNVRRNKWRPDDDEEDFDFDDSDLESDDSDLDGDDSDQDDDDPEIVSTVLAKNQVTWLTPIENG